MSVTIHFYLWEDLFYNDWVIGGSQYKGVRSEEFNIGRTIKSCYHFVLKINWPTRYQSLKSKALQDIKSNVKEDEVQCEYFS